MEGIRDLFSEFFGTIGALDSIRVTVIMSFWSTLIASVLGVFLGLLLERKDFPGKRAVIRLNRTLMGAPPVVIGLLAYMILRDGLLLRGADGSGDPHVCKDHGRHGAADRMAPGEGDEE